MTAVLELQPSLSVQPAISFKSLEEELHAFDEMSEEEAVKLYNVDYKEEARVFITEHWDYVNSKDLREAYL